MQSNHTRNHKNAQIAEKDKSGDFVKSAVKQGEEKITHIAQDAQTQFKQGQEQIGQIIGTVDKQVRKNPWPVLVSVALGSFLLGCLVDISKKK